MEVQIRRFNLLFRAIEWRLMDSHAVRKMRFEQVVISPGDFSKGLSQLTLLVGVEIDQRTLMRLADDHGLKRPCCPPGTHHDECLVLENHPLLFPTLQGCIVLQHVLTSAFATILFQLFQFHGRLLGQRAGRPNLSVRVRVRTTHRGTFILEDLHIPVLLLGLGQAGCGRVGWQGGGRGDRSQRRVGRQVRRIDLGPGIDDGDDLRGRQVGQGEIMGCGEGEDVAFAGDGLCSQEQRLEL